MGKRMYHIRFRCYFGKNAGNYTDHNMVMELKEIGRWIEAYTFTHPNVHSITAKVWPQDEEVSR